MDLVHADQTDYTPDLAIDGYISNTWHGYYHSWDELYAWFQLEFDTAVTVKSASIIQRMDCCSDLNFKDVAVTVGDNPAVKYQLSTNELCAFYPGPPTLGQNVVFDCAQPITGRYLIVQITNANEGPIYINEITVCGYM